MPKSVVSLCLGALLVACGPTVKSAARDASRAAVDESVEQLKDEETQKHIAEASKDPELAAATERMSKEIADGLLRSLSTPEAQDRVRALANVLASATVEEMLRTLANEANGPRMARVTSAMTDAALKQVAESMREELGPAMRETMQKDLAPALGQVLDTELQASLGNTAEQVAYRAVLGANRGVDTVWADASGFAGDVQGLSGVGASVVRTLSWLFLLLAISLVAIAAIVIARARRVRHETARLESATLLLATAMQERHQSAETNELVEVVRQALSERAVHNGRHRLLDALHLRRPH